MSIGRKSRRIIIVVSGLSSQLAGGMQVQAEGAARELAKDREVVVLTRAWGKRLQLGDTDRFRVVVKPVFPVPALRFVIDFALTCWHLARLRRGTDAIVAYQTLGTGLIAALCGAALGVPTIVWLRSAGEYGRDVQNPVKRVLSRLTWSLATRILIQTSRMRDEFVAQFRSGRSSTAANLADKTVVVPNGVELAESTVAPDRADRVIFTGRLDPIKGLTFLIEAVRSLPESDQPSITFVGSDLTDNSPFEQSLKRAAEGLRATFTGRVQHAEVRSYLLEGGIFVLPSLVEGMPNTLLEAMAVGLPCIATAVGGVPDIIRDGENGLLVPPADPVALGDAIRKLQSDAALRTRLSVAGRASAAQYTWEKLRERLIVEIEEINHFHLAATDQP